MVNAKLESEQEEKKRKKLLLKKEIKNKESI